MKILLCFPDLKIIDSFLTGLQKISAHAFKHIRGLKRLDLSDNGISNIDYNAFDEVNMDFIGSLYCHEWCDDKVFLKMCLKTNLWNEILKVKVGLSSSLFHSTSNSYYVKHGPRNI